MPTIIATMTITTATTMPMIIPNLEEYSTKTISESPLCPSNADKDFIANLKSSSICG